MSPAKGRVDAAINELLEKESAQNELRVGLVRLDRRSHRAARRAQAPVKIFTLAR